MKVLERKLMFTRQITECYRHAERFHLTCDQLTESINLSVWNDPRFKNLPMYTQHYIEGYHQAVRDRFWTEVLVWLVWLDGQLVASKDVPYSRWSDTKPGCHVYNANPSKPFTAIQE